MNELNKVFQGLIQGGTDVASGLIEKNRKDKLSELYDNSLNKLNEFLTPQINQTRTPQGGMVEQQGQPDVKGALNYLYQQAPNFNSEDGKGYLSLLGKFFEDAQPKQVKPEYREVGGQLLDVSDPTNPKVVYGDKEKEKPTKKTAEDYGNLSYEDALKLDPTELENAFDYFNPDVQAKLKEKYSQFNEVEKTKSGSRRTGSRRFSTKKSPTEPNLDNVDTTPEDNNVSPDIWADVRNAENKIKEKYDKYNSTDKKKIQEQRTTVATDLKGFEDEWKSGKYSVDEIKDAMNSYIADLEKEGYDDDVLDEAFAYIKKRALELGIAF